MCLHVYAHTCASMNHYFMSSTSTWCYTNVVACNLNHTFHSKYFATAHLYIRTMYEVFTPKDKVCVYYTCKYMYLMPLGGALMYM